MQALFFAALVGAASAGFLPPSPTPVDCQYTRFTQWTECSEPCGVQGTQSRTRQIQVQAQLGGIPCDPSLLEEWRPCLTPCKVDCQMGPWSQYSQCQTQGFGSPTCGLGQQQRSRQILVQPSNGGLPCGQTIDVKQCDLGPCPLNCQMAQWTQWSQCQSQTGQRCGSGNRQRTRQIIQHPQNGGAPCGQTEEWEQCDLGPCSVDCQMSQWSQYSQCQSFDFNKPSCGPGQQQRSRQILVQPKNGGRPCGQLTDVKQCDLGPCAENCEMSFWSQWSQCQSSNGQQCGKGNRQRTRQITKQPTNGGRQCGALEEWEQCDLGPCVVHCQMSQWSQYSQCQSFDFNKPSCGPGQQQRSRQILVHPKNGGQPCGQLTDVKQCDLGPCSQDCVMGQWGPFGQCFSQTGQQCGLGSRTRTRQIIQPDLNGGRPCQSTTETEQCDLGPCAPNCIGRPVEFHINPQQPCSPSYYKCVNQQALSLTCPSGKMFDIKTFKCLPRFQVQACF